MACSGDATKRCGGDFSVDLYTISDPLPERLETNITYVGCYK